ncbi:hypothetical protein [Kocuria rosea]|uniref:hypothetical protein n=1 Tax=Kocuria rosea TaxID=1275 RepID=UPI002540845B|nr:hypothetical protein [Kocuria rosea]WIG18817.1 hypothetical protein QOY29_07840 [Kocuria rosea]
MLTHTMGNLLLVAQVRVAKHEVMTFHHAPVRGSSAAVALLCAGMVMSGTIGYFVVESGAPPLVVVFWRCVIGACGGTVR